MFSFFSIFFFNLSFLLLIIRLSLLHAAHVSACALCLCFGQTYNDLPIAKWFGGTTGCHFVRCRRRFDLHLRAGPRLRVRPSESRISSSTQLFILQRSASFSLCFASVFERSSDPFLCEGFTCNGTAISLCPSGSFCPTALASDRQKCPEGIVSTVLLRDVLHLTLFACAQAIGAQSASAIP
jgi:hypothetical protein